LKKAQKISDKKKYYILSERIDLLKAQNQIVKGNFKKGINAVTEQLDNLRVENQSLAYYILVTTFLQMDNKALPLKYYNELQTSSESDAFVKIVQKDFE
jgi:hypothetical protein